MRTPVAAALGAALMLTACSKANITTTVKADGSVERKLTFNLAAKPMAGPPKLEKMFKPLGEGWTRDDGMEGEEVKVVFTRTFTKDKLSGAVDLQQLETIDEEPENPFAEPDPNAQPKPAPKARVLLTNEVSVKEIAPGKFEYREKIKWLGERKPPKFEPKQKEILEKVKLKLPEGKRTDEEVKVIAELLVAETVRFAAGPGEPKMMLFISQPEVAFRNLRIQLGDVLMAHLAGRYGDAMDEEARLEMTRMVLEGFNLEDSIKGEVNDSKPKPGAGEEEEKKDKVDSVAMTFALKFPGKVVMTNGKLDPYHNEVFWGVYPMAVEFGDVELIAVFEVPTGDAKKGK